MIVDWPSFWGGVTVSVGVVAIVIGVIVVLNGVYEMGRKDGRTEGNR
jgi:hypothetical protein